MSRPSRTIALVPGRIQVVPPGQQAEDALVALLQAAQRVDPLRVVTVVVRSPLVARDLRRRLAARGAFGAVRFTPLSRLAELLAAASEQGRRPLSAVALRAAVRAGLSRSPGIFAEVAEHPATEESLAAAYRLFRRLPEADRRRYASLSTRARDVVALYEAVRRELTGAWYDPDDLALAAAERMARGGAELSEVGPVLVHLPDPLRPAEIGLLEALGRHGEVTALIGRTGDEVADRAGGRTLGELKRRGYEELAGGEAASSRPLRFERVIAAPDAEEEVRTALRLLMAHAEKGGELGRTIVALPSSSEGIAYAHLVAELFAQAEVSWTGPAVGRLAESGPGKLVVDLAGLLVDPARLFERAEVVRLLSSPFLEAASPLFAGTSFLSCEGRPGLRAGAIDRCSRAAGVVSGSEEWTRRLRSYERRAEQFMVSGAPPQVAGDLALVLGRLVAIADEARRAASWPELASWAARLAEAVTVPGEERDRLVDALGELSHLDGLERLFAPGPSEEEAGRRQRQVRAAVEAALSQASPSLGRFGVGPVVGSLPALAGMRSDLLVVLGAGEGTLPGRTPEDPLVTELERQQLPLLLEEERREERDRRALCWLLAGAEQAVAVYPRVGRGAGRPCYPSRWLAGDLFFGPHEQVASFAAGLAAVAGGRFRPADEADLELAVVVASAGRRRLGDLFVADLGDLGRRLLAERERWSPLSRFAGLVGGRPFDDGVFAEVMSATRVEALARCPLSFMFERLAKISVLEAPDRLHMIEPRVRGNLIHEVLEEFVAATVASEDAAARWKAGDLSELREIAERHLAEVERRGLGGKPIYWRMARRRILEDLERFCLLEAARLAESGARPVRTEMTFGYGEGVPAVEVLLSPAGDAETGQAVMRFRGKIDRIDVEPGGVVRVIDYKSGRDAGYPRGEADPLDGGRHLQLPLYAKAARLALGDEARSVIAEYRFCSSEARFRRLPVELTEELEERLGSVLGTLGATIERGVFPPRPGNGNEAQPANCRSCDYDSICRLDRAAAWERASGEEELAAYVELVQGKRP